MGQDKLYAKTFTCYVQALYGRDFPFAWPLQYSSINLEVVRRDAVTREVVQPGPRSRVYPRVLEREHIVELRQERTCDAARTIHGVHCCTALLQPPATAALPMMRDVPPPLCYD